MYRTHCFQTRQLSIVLHKTSVNAVLGEAPNEEVAMVHASNMCMPLSLANTNSTAVCSVEQDRLSPSSEFVRSSKMIPALISPTQDNDGHTPSCSPLVRLNIENGVSNMEMSNRGDECSQPLRLNKFVRRLHGMLVEEKGRGIVEWRKGLLVLHSTEAFTKIVLPKYFNTRNFKTFRRQLNYYQFVHVRSFASTSRAPGTTALWVNQELAKVGNDSISSILLLRRAHPCADTKTAEGRRLRKEEAFHTIEEAEISHETSSSSRSNSFDASHHACEDSTCSSLDEQGQDLLCFNVDEDHRVNTLGYKSVDRNLGAAHRSPCEMCSGSAMITSSMDDAARLLLMLSHSTPITP